MIQMRFYRIKLLAIAGLSVLVVSLLVGFRSVRLKTGWEVFEDVQEVADTISAALFYSMVAIDGNGEVQSGKAVMFFDMDSRESRMILHITEPDKWAGISLLVVQGKEQPDTVFLQRPGIKIAEEIKGRLLQNYLLFMSWSYLDFLQEKEDAEKYERREDVAFNGVDSYRVVARPITPERKRMSGYGERHFWVSKKDNAVLKVNFLNEQGRLLKTARMMDFQSLGPSQKGPKQAMRIELTHHLRKISETYVITGIQGKVDYPENFFSPETLPNRDWETFLATLKQKVSE